MGIRLIVPTDVGRDNPQFQIFESTMTGFSPRAVTTSFVLYKKRGHGITVLQMTIRGWKPRRGTVLVGIERVSRQIFDPQRSFKAIWTTSYTLDIVRHCHHDVFVH